MLSRIAQFVIGSASRITALKRGFFLQDTEIRANDGYQQCEPIFKPKLGLTTVAYIACVDCVESTVDLSVVRNCAVLTCPLSYQTVFMFPPVPDSYTRVAVT